MALLNHLGHYIKIEIQDNSLIVIYYTSQSQREVEKTALYSWQQILAWYDEQLNLRYEVMVDLAVNKYHILPEQAEEIPTMVDKPDLVEANKAYWDLNNERFAFNSACESKEATGGYPLICQIKNIAPEDVLDSIPRDSGGTIVVLPVDINSVEEAYEYVKVSRIFGKTRDI